MPEITYDVVKDGEVHRYRIKSGERVLLVSGGFLEEADADSCGRHVAMDPEVRAYLPKETL